MNEYYFSNTYKHDGIYMGWSLFDPKFRPFLFFFILAAFLDHFVTGQFAKRVYIIVKNFSEDGRKKN